MGRVQGDSIQFYSLCFIVEVHVCVYVLLPWCLQGNATLHLYPHFNELQHIKGVVVKFDYVNQIM